MADGLDRISPLLAIADPGRFGAEGEPGVGLSDRLCDSLVQVQAWPDTIAETKAWLQSQADRFDIAGWIGHRVPPRLVTGDESLIMTP